MDTQLLGLTSPHHKRISIVKSDGVEPGQTIFFVKALFNIIIDTIPVLTQL